MGIQGLLPMVKEALQAKTLEAYRDKTVAVDAYVWLHRGVYTCAQELATGKHSNKYVAYCMGKVRMLQHFGVKPYIVFDGSPLPSKGGTETDRAAKRADALKKANSFLAAGKNDAARDEFVKAVDVTPAMAYQFIKALKAAGVPYVVAPFEADAQLAFLERNGHVDAIISEDSDLIVFGCNRILYKLDQAGAVMEYSRDRLTACTEHRFHGWTEERFRQMAILSGCDYLAGLGGLGIKGSHQLFYKYKAAVKVVEQVRLAGKVKVPKDYMTDFKRADMTFVHQVVFDPNSQTAVHLTALPPKGLPDHIFEAVGGKLSSELALGIARGDIDPSTMEPMIDLGPATEPSPVMERALKPSTSFYKPKAAKAAVSSGPLDAFFAFGKKPAAVKEARPALGSVKANEPKKSPAKQHVASKFFGGQPSPPKSKAASSKSESLIHEDDIDSEGMAALLEVEKSMVAEQPGDEVAIVTDNETIEVRDETMVVEVTKEETDPSISLLAPTSESALDLPTSEMMVVSDTPSPRRKKRRLIEPEELMELESSPSSVKAEPGGFAKQEPKSPVYFGSPVSSPKGEVALKTPTKKVVQTWHHLFRRSSSGQKAETTLPAPRHTTSSSARKPASPLRTSSSLTSNSPPSSQGDVAKPAKSPVLKRKEPPPATVTSRDRPLSTFLYKRPRT